MVDLRTSEEWNQVKLHKIMDPDGWDRSNFKWSWYEQLITEDEFEARLAKSTTILDWSEIVIARPTKITALKPRFTSSVLHGTTDGTHLVNHCKDIKLNTDFCNR